MSTRNRGRHRARSRASQTGARVGAVAAAVTSVAVVGGATVPTAPAAAAPFVLSQKCAGGSGTVASNVNCQNSVASPIGSVIGAALPDDLTAVLKFLKIDLNSSAIVIASNGTATISGTGFALAAQALNAPLIGGVGGTSTANAVTPLSAALAIGTGKGTASATAVSGVAVAAAGSGTASAVSVGGVATAINILGIKNVTCTALYGHASADGVGACTSVLYIFTAKNAAGSDVWTFAIADPTSFTLGGDGALPIPHFARDLIRVSVGGPSGVRVGTDLFTLPTTESKNAVSVSSRAATSTVSKQVASKSVAPVTRSSVSTPSVAEQEQIPSVASAPATTTAAATTGKHRKPDAESASVGAELTSVDAQSASVGAQPTSLGAQSASAAAQSASATAQSTGGSGAETD
ncbi:hypothetical protein [Williamsia sp.]|uniref:hypothetical protein n=1 Tax=Williamsia sp. TaxID=1872085 RepID=UPI001A2A74E3|nr:hypothetical protein [Williamsia sp.]MBJ7290442.1 hypothetical protein [Williamsia sp.]